MPFRCPCPNQRGTSADAPSKKTRHCMLSCRNVGTAAGQRPPVGMPAARGICQHLHKLPGLLKGFALILLHACSCERGLCSEPFPVFASPMLQAIVEGIRGPMPSCQLTLLGLMLSVSRCKSFSRAESFYYCHWERDEHQQCNGAGCLQIAGQGPALLHARSCLIQKLECCQSSSA